MTCLEKTNSSINKKIEKYPHLVKIPKYVQEIDEKISQCYMHENRCIHCWDCVAFALLYAEDNDLKLPNQGTIWLITGDSKETAFMKFLMSTITKKYLRCGKGLSINNAMRFSKWLLRLNKNEKKLYRSTLLCHEEFHDDLTKGVKIYKRKSNLDDWNEKRKRQKNSQFKKKSEKKVND